MEPIHFYGHGDPYFEFSNFYKRTILVGGRQYRTVEHYYQAEKARDPIVRAEIVACRTPKDAATMGRTIQLDTRWWDGVKDGVMLTALRAKFTQHEDLKQLLISTGDAVIVERSFRDRYWGDGGDGSGKNRLGFTLMQVRAELLMENG